MNWRPMLYLAVLVGLLTALLLPARSRATAPGRNGRITYMRKDRAGHWQIWVASARLTGARQLTHGNYDSGWPVWSPNGKKIAFDSNRTDHSPKDSRQVNDVFVMNADGSHVKKLTDSKDVSGDAAWSPNGSLIAFDADRGTRKDLRAIYVINPKGGKLQRVTRPRPPLSDYSPGFSPDGTHLVFLRARGTSENAPAALFTVRLDGSSLHRLTSFAMHVGEPDWSPDGARIVFEAHPNPAAYPDIYVINATGGRPVNLTHNPTGQAGSADPVWSPNGRKILFRDNRYLNGTGRTGLASMNQDGSKRHFLSSKNVEARQPDWESVR
jgi:TolB protein